jgi:lipopolysaccharide export system protein LptA
VRLTIERMRTLVLAAGVLLLVALVAFLAIGKWKNPLNRRDLPKRLGLDIVQEANGYTFSHSLGAHSKYEIHASKVVELKNKRVLLHDVKIVLYDDDGKRADRIEGAEFEYDQDKGVAKADGPVEIWMTRPRLTPAVAPKTAPGQGVGAKPKGTPLAAAAEAASAGEIHVKTSGLTFDTNSGVAETAQRVEFAMTQGTGSSLGASFHSQEGTLVLDAAVELNAQRGVEAVQLHAGHAEFERESQQCLLRAAKADYRGGESTAGAAKILFRDDGSVVRLEATSGFALTTASGGRLTAPTGQMDFDEHNQPHHGHLAGGVTIDALGGKEEKDRKLHGTSPTMELEFTARGQLRHAHLERGVEFVSQEQSQQADGLLRVNRTWHSPVAEVEFRVAGHGQLEPSEIHGMGGVVVTGESQRGKGPKMPSRMTADEVTGQFGAGSVLTAMTGAGHASVAQTSQTGTRQTTSGDRLEAHFEVPVKGVKPGAKQGTGGGTEIQSATVDGHVTLTDEPAAKSGAQAAAPLKATAGRAVYEGAGEWLHLTLGPRVEDGGLQLTADKIDVSQASGDAFAHGNVKASWLSSGGNRGQGKPGQDGPALGGQGPAHAIAAEAQLHQATGEATFRGHARLWQQANSISGPVIVLDRMRQTLVVRTTDAGEPVKAVMVSAAGSGPAKEAGGKAQEPSVIRVSGGDLKYSDAERKAVMHGGAAGTVLSETGTATVNSNDLELQLLPAGNHAGRDGGAAQVDRMTAKGRVVIVSQGRRGTGEQLVYTGQTGEYVLTGTASLRPRMSDPARGAVSGEALIFNSRNDSVSIEGGGRKTTTETTAPK